MLVSHYANRAYLENRATNANKAISNAVYHGPKRNFSIETYYFILSGAFNDLANAGTAHALNEEQKIMKFKTGLRDPNAIKFALQAKSSYDNLPEDQRNFDAYYNEFSSLMTEYSTLMGVKPNQTRTSQLNPFGSQSSGRGRGRGRSGRGRGGRGRSSFGRGRASGRFSSSGRTSSHYSPYDSNSSYTPHAGQFVPEAKIYPQDIYNSLSYHQRQAIGNLKASQGWLDQVTPPPGFNIDRASGLAVPSNAIVNALRSANIGLTQSISDNGSVTPPPPSITLPPAPGTSNPPNPPIHDNSRGSSIAGASFGRSGTRNNTDTSTVGMVSINGQPYNGDIYDRNGNRIN